MKTILLTLLLLGTQPAVFAAEISECRAGQTERTADCLTADEIRMAQNYGLSNEQTLSSLRAGRRNAAFVAAMARELKECLATPGAKKARLLSQANAVLRPRNFETLQRSVSIRDYEDALADMGDAMNLKFEKIIMTVCRW